MQLSVKQYDTLIKLINLTYEHKDVFSDEEIKLLDCSNESLVKIYDKHLLNNKRTADYIAKRRVENKNYARSKV